MDNEIILEVKELLKHIDYLEINLSDEFQKNKDNANTALMATAFWVAASGIGLEELKPIIAQHFNINDATYNELMEMLHISSKQDASSLVLATTAVAAAVPTIVIPLAGIKIFKAVRYYEYKFIVIRIFKTVAQ